MLKRIVSVLLALLLCLGACAEVTDKNGLLTADEEEYLEEYLALVNGHSAYYVTLSTDKKSKASYRAEDGYLGGILLYADGKGAEGLKTSGGAGELAQELEQRSLYTEYFDEGLYAEGFDDMLTCIDAYLDAARQELPCAIGEMMTDGSSVRLTVTIENRTEEKKKLSDCLSALAVNGTEAEKAKLGFRYKEVWAGEELSGEATFELAPGEWQLYVFAGGVRYDAGTAVIRGKEDAKADVVKGQSYSSKLEVARYIRLYGCLPPNYITKNQAKKLGWDSSGGNLWKVAPGKSIGGDRFGNYEGVLPDGDYTECDIDYDGGYRDAKRLVFCRDGKDWRIYYTEDHYNTFEEIR